MTSTLKPLTGIRVLDFTAFPPGGEHSGHDLSYLAHSGLLAAVSGDQLWQPGISLSLQAGALGAVVGIQAALLQRVRTGEGAFVDLSLSESATWFPSCGINPLSDRPFVLPMTPDRRRSPPCVAMAYRSHSARVFSFGQTRKSAMWRRISI
jgi:CoA transferase family III